MKKILWIVVLFIMIINIAKSQGYQVFTSNRDALYSSGSGEVKFVRIDSVNSTSDSIFYPITNIQQVGYNCFLPNAYSWIGKKIIIQPNGNNLFLNRMNDTILIKTRNGINDPWTAYKQGTLLNVVANVIQVDTLRIFGQLDSVKTIGFQVYDAAMNPLPNILNQRKLLLSKNHGLVKTVNFCLFPEPYITNTNEYLDTFQLIGLSKPDFGIQNLRWFDVNDFQVGDVLHILHEENNWNSPSNGYSKGVKKIFKYLDRTDMTDSIIYSIDCEVSMFDYQKATGDTTFAYTHDTLRVVILPNLMFDKLPGEIIANGNTVYTYLMNCNNPISKIKPASSIHQSITDSCWNYPVVDGCFPDYTYLKGLGGPYYECVYSFEKQSNKLVYYKKGSVTWGIPLSVDQCQDENIIHAISTYPNPASTNVKLKLNLTSKSATLQVFTLWGNKVESRDLPAGTSEYTLPIAHYSKGIYMVRLQYSDGTQATSKMVKQ